MSAPLPAGPPDLSGPDRLLAEVAEQPRVIAGLLQDAPGVVRELAAAVHRREPSAIVLVARGSSDHAAIYARYLFEICNQQLTALAAPSALTLYGRGPRLDRALVIGVSQSGRGEDVLSYVEHARAQGGMTVALVNDEVSPLARAAEWVLPSRAGPELSVPATKTVTAQMCLLAMLASALADHTTDFAALAPLPAAVQHAVDQRPAAAGLARRLAERTIDAVIGRGFAFPPALEIALKLKETSYTPAEPFSAADFLHGPVALVEADYTAVVLDVGGRSSEPAAQITRQVHQRGGRAVLLRAAPTPVAPGPGGDSSALSLALEVPVDEPYAPIVALVLGQLLAIELALARGLDPAQPRGLRKVTSTR